LAEKKGEKIEALVSFFFLNLSYDQHVFLQRSRKKMPRALKYAPFPRPDGCQDLKMDTIGHVFKKGKGTPCAYDLVNVDEFGLKIRTRTICTGTKANPCDHVVTEDQSKFHNVWRITRILASLMKAEGAFEKEANKRMKRQQFAEIFDGVTLKYCPEMHGIWKVNKILAEREAAQLFINTNDRPWASSGSVRDEMAMERKRDPKIDDAAAEIRVLLNWFPESMEEKVRYWNREVKKQTDKMTEDLKVKGKFTKVKYYPSLPMPALGHPQESSLTMRIRR
jgi:hypothetical protein